MDKELLEFLQGMEQRLSDTIDLKMGTLGKEVGTLRQEVGTLRHDVRKETLEMFEKSRQETNDMLTDFATTIIDQIKDLRKDISGLHEDHRHLAEMFGAHELEIRRLKERY